MAYLYRHIRQDSNQPFYIGIGSNDDYGRANSKHGRNKIWNGVVKKSKYDVEIILDDLTWEEACEKEKEFIALYGRKDNSTGCLCNLTNGGEGTLGCIPSKETLLKRSISLSGSNNPLYGKKLSKEHKEKLSKAKLGKHRDPLVMKHLHECRKKKVTNGDIIFNSLGEAALYYKVHQTTVTRWISKGLKNLNYL